jgi:hypothetical protein
MLKIIYILMLQQDDAQKVERAREPDAPELDMHTIT